MNRYDDRARLVFHYAREEGNRLGHNLVGPEHLLLGIMREGGTAARILGEFGVTLEKTRGSIEGILGRGNSERTNDAPAITPRARRVMELASAEAHSLGASVTSTEHILLAIIREQDGIAYRVLRELTGDVDAVRLRILGDAAIKQEQSADTALADTALTAAREAAFEVKAQLAASLQEPPPDPALLVARALSVTADAELRFLLGEAVSRWLNGGQLGFEQTRAVVGLLVNASR